MFHFLRRTVLLVVAAAFFVFASAVHVDAASVPNRYTDKARKFSIDLPKGWKTLEDSGRGKTGKLLLVLEETNTPSGMRPAQFTLEVEDVAMTSADALRQKKEEGVAILRDAVSDLQIMRDSASCIAGANAHLIELTALTEDGQRGRVNSIFIGHDSRLYVVVLTGIDEQWEKRYAPLLKKIISSFRLSTKANACSPKTTKQFTTLKGEGFRGKHPKSWVASDAEALKEINSAFESLGFPLRAHALLSHPTYENRAYIIVASDPETKKDGKTLDAKGYAVESLRQSGIKPNTKAMKALKMAGLPAVQWSMIDPQTKKESVMTTVITKAGIAYSIFLDVEGGLYQKDKALRNAYSTLQKTFKLTKKVKSKKAKGKK